MIIAVSFIISYHGSVAEHSYVSHMLDIDLSCFRQYHIYLEHCSPLSIS